VPTDVGVHTVSYRVSFVDKLGIVNYGTTGRLTVSLDVEIKPMC